MDLTASNAESPIPVAPGVIAPWQRELAAVCCYFNPCHYQSRMRNYHLFRTDIVKTGIHLLTVELALGDDDWELQGVPNVLRLRAKDMLWHKERLLNVGIAQLIREGFQKIVWVDADILFHDASWPEKLSNMLDRFPLCQAFAEAARKTARDEPLEFAPGAIKRLFDTGELKGALSGLAWAARADLLKREPIYDACVVGGSDQILCFAGFYDFRNPDTDFVLDHVCRHMSMAPMRQEHFYRWATRFGDLVRGEVGFIPGVVESLYHGEKIHRQLLSRYDMVTDYNPFQDIALNDDQCWRWATDKPRLHQDLRDYFLQRREDD